MRNTSIKLRFFYNQNQKSQNLGPLAMTEGGRGVEPDEDRPDPLSPGTCRASSGFLPARRAATDGVASGWVNRHDLLRFADPGQQEETRVSSARSCQVRIRSMVAVPTRGKRSRGSGGFAAECDFQLRY